MRWLEGEFADGERHGKWTLYHPDGWRRAEGRYEAGEREGSWTFWSSDGEIDERRSGAYSEGVRAEDR